MAPHIFGEMILAGMSFWVGWFARQWWAGRQSVEQVVTVGETTTEVAPVTTPEPEPVNPIPGRNWCLLYGADGTLHSVRTMADDPPPYFERHHGKGVLRRYVLASQDEERFVYRLKS